MKRIICKKEYNTETSECLGGFTHGCYGDPDGFEERLYRTADGYYFLYGLGGEDSPYPRETIKRMSKDAAEEWEKNNL